MVKQKTVALDVDGVCVTFSEDFINHCKNFNVNLCVDKNWNFFDQDIRAYDLFKELKNEFWLNLGREPKSLDLNLVPAAYISHRSCPTEVTRQCLVHLGFPDAPIIHTKYTEDKLKIFKDLEIDIFVDDRASTVAYFLENGIEAYVLDQIWNEDFNLPRIHSLGELDRIINQSEYKTVSKK